MIIIAMGAAEIILHERQPVLISLPGVVKRVRALVLSWPLPTAGYDPCFVSALVVSSIAAGRGVFKDAVAAMPSMSLPRADQALQSVHGTILAE